MGRDRANPMMSSGDNRSRAKGNRAARDPISQYRKALATHEVKSSAGKREKKDLLAGADARLDRSDRLGFFRSTPFLLFMLLIVGVAISYAFFLLAFTETEKMNEMPKNFRRPDAPQARKPAIGG